MKSTLLKTCIPALSLLGGMSAPLHLAAQGQQTITPRYTVHDLGAVSGPLGQTHVISNNGLVNGAAAVPDGTTHAVLWYKGQKIDIGTQGLGGPNSVAFGVNDRGQAVGEAETSVPNGDDFCGFKAYGLSSSATTCLPFLWENGVTTKLPTLGGANGGANMINNRGEVAGYAETTLPDPDGACSVARFAPVIWENGRIRQQLDTWAGDPDGVAAWINDNGQAVGASGACAAFNPNTGYFLSENHALLWEKDGSVHDLGNLGGSGGIAGNHACAINNKGQVVGHSELTGNTTFHGFVWNRHTGMRDVGTLPGDYASLALDINDGGQVVGASLDAAFNPRAFVLRHGAPVDLNTLVPGDAGLYLLFANAVNSSGEIAGIAVNGTGELHAFVATPADAAAGDESISALSHGANGSMALSAEARKLVLRRLGIRAQ